MRKLFIFGYLMAGLATLGACSSGTSLTPGAAIPLVGSDQEVLGDQLRYPSDTTATPVCDVQSNSATAQCMTVKLATPASTSAPTGGYAPSDLRAAYNLVSAATTSGSTQTIAIVIAYSDPYIATELSTYRSHYGLPACTTSNGCLSIVVENGKPAPPASTAWAQEAALDVEMVSALCPLCKIMVAEALSNSVSDLGQTVSYAVTKGATVVSNSFATTESGATQYNSYWNHPGVPITAGAGDGGYGVGFPASSQYVTAIGGTTLTKNSSGTFSSTVWARSGAGCSAAIAKPSWQKDAGCKMRTENDLAVVADPSTGVAVYSFYAGGWVVFGGTSVGAPIVASMYALAGNGKSLGIKDASYMYSHGTWAPIASGSDGTCSVSYLCTAVPSGYSGPGGLGSPYGLAAF